MRRGRPERLGAAVTLSRREDHDPLRARSPPTDRGASADAMVPRLPCPGPCLVSVPAISVCIPTYNYARYLGQAVKSVLEQTFRDFELIVCDDASTDATLAVLDTFADERLKVFQNPANLGLFANFNRCLELARGDLVKYVCADDWLHPRYLEQAVAVLSAHAEVNFLTSAGFLVDADSRVFGLTTTDLGPGPVVPARTALAAQARSLNIIGMPTNVTVRRAALETLGGFDGRFAPAADVHLWLRLLARSDLGWLPEPLCFLRMHASKSHSYGANPSESTFQSWEDVARQPQSPIGSSLLQDALYAEAERSLLYVMTHLAGGRFGRARRILAFTHRHVRWRWVLPRFLRRLPRLAHAQLSRIRAARSGRLVVYGQRTRMGPRLARTTRPLA